MVVVLGYVILCFVMLALFGIGYLCGVSAGKSEADSKYKDKIVVKQKEVVVNED